MEIIIKTIPHNKQRYNTAGDYFRKNGKDYIFVSDLNNRWMELLIAIHELFESELCRQRGIKEQDITKFDVEFEKLRVEGFVSKEAEPGDNSYAPYFNEHQIACQLEKLTSRYLKVGWEEYTKKCNQLEYEQPKKKSHPKNIPGKRRH